MKSIRQKTAKIAAIALLVAPVLAGAQEAPTYAQASGVSGTIKSIGSDTMNNLMTLWAEGFRTFHPSVRIEVEGKGSSTAPPALIAGTAQ